MAALIRIKRKSSTEPSEALVVASKKARNETEVETVFQFVGTLKKTDEHNDKNIDALIKQHRLHRAQWGKNPKIRNTDFRETNRNYSEKRLKLLNVYRNIPKDICKETDDTEETTGCTNNELLEQEKAVSNEVKDLYQVYDVHEEEENQETASCKEKEDQITCNGVPLLKQKIDFVCENEDFVYDLYYAPEDDFNVQSVENVISIKGCSLENDLVLPDHEGESDCFDDDDSNDEDNWRNDYPEEDSDFEKNLDYYGDYGDDIDNDDLLAKMHDCDIASDEVCSDDDDYNEPDNRYDHTYAKYKQEMTKPSSDDDEV